MIGKLDRETFVTEYWRKQAVLLPQAVIPPLLTEQTLTDLAANDLVESRSVSGDQQLSIGPFDVLPRNELIMINGLDLHLSSCDELLKTYFSFLPRWRIDDVMATMGSAGTHCGAHFDHYDVFLVQVLGTKNWQLDAGGHQEEELDSASDIRLLRNFTGTRTFEAEPGDVLYVPARMGHWGVNAGESITLSIGIRNPTLTELVSEVADFLIDQDLPVATLDDALQRPDAGIVTDDIAQLREQLLACFEKDSLLADWYGEYSTRLREPDVIQELTGDEARIAETPRLQHYTRITWFEAPETLNVYVNGITVEAHPSALRWLKPLVQNREYQFETSLSSADQHLMMALHKAGALCDE